MQKGGVCAVDSGSAGLCLPNTADTCTSRGDMRSLTSSPISSPLSLGSLQPLFPTQTKYFTGKVRWREGPWYPPVRPREDWCPPCTTTTRFLSSWPKLLAAPGSRPSGRGPPPSPPFQTTPQILTRFAVLLSLMPYLQQYSVPWTCMWLFGEQGSHQGWDRDPCFSQILLLFLHLFCLSTDKDVMQSRMTSRAQCRLFWRVIITPG